MMRMMEKMIMMMMMIAFNSIALVNAQMEGWRMVDRFSGFRFEITGKVRSDDTHTPALIIWRLRTLLLSILPPPLQS